MSKLRWLSILMGITILAVTGFQVYWLKENYEREENSLTLLAEFHFREVMMELQVAKLNLPELADSAGRGKMKLFVQKGDPPVSIRMKPRNEVVSAFNVIRGKMKDSLKNANKPVVISMDQTSVSVSRDSMRVDRKLIGGGPDHIFNLLYGVDSLQDSIRIPEVDSALREAFSRESINVPFEVKKYAAMEEEGPAMNRVTIGIRKPVSYELDLGNTFPYVVKKITLPILFSVLLLGITITSFVLLYRNFVRQKRLADLKNEFISNITHELKTPIATVGVAIEALRNFNAIEDTRKTKEYLDISANELQRLGLLVDKVLRLSMFEKKEVGLKREEVDLGSLVDEVVNSMKLQFEKSKADVYVTKAGDLNLRADRLHLLSVIFNLVDNALKYSSGEPRISISVTGNEKRAELVVADNGIGIPTEYKGRIFEKFFRVPHGNTHNAKGYGLGLSYVAYVIKRHEGNISVKDNEGGGSIFSVTIPKS